VDKRTLSLDGVLILEIKRGTGSSLKSTLLKAPFLIGHGADIFPIKDMDTVQKLFRTENVR